MARRFVDLSVPLETGIVSDPPIMLPQIEYMTHDQTAAQVMAFFPGLKKEDLPGGEEAQAGPDANRRDVRVAGPGHCGSDAEQG